MFVELNDTFRFYTLWRLLNENKRIIIFSWRRRMAKITIWLKLTSDHHAKASHTVVGPSHYRIFDRCSMV